MCELCLSEWLDLPEPLDADGLEGLFAVDGLWTRPVETRFLLLLPVLTLFPDGE